MNDQGKKNRPTPSRKSAQSKNYRPVVTGKKRKLTKEEQREERRKRDELYARQQEAMRSGDDRYMPERYRGVERRFARDYIDARRNFSSLFMPLALLTILLIFVQQIIPKIVFYTMVGTYVIFALMIVDSVIASRNAYKLTAYKFGVNKVPRGLRWNMFTRTFYPRRFRMPSAQVKAGQYPDSGSPKDLKAAKKALKN
ncbi:MAG: DUF3043 domain-containing protein [Actinomycetaceae bacterium]|nr:DUF3043 domain-containing protein [Actinomycetaceae bacterium]